MSRRNADYEAAAEGMHFELSTAAYRGEALPPCEVSQAESDAVIWAGCVCILV